MPRDQEKENIQLLIDCLKEAWPEACEGLSGPVAETMTQPNRAATTMDDKEHQRPAQDTKATGENRLQNAGDIHPQLLVLKRSAPITSPQEVSEPESGSAQGNPGNTEGLSDPSRIRSLRARRPVNYDVQVHPQDEELRIAGVFDKADQKRQD